MRLVLDTNAAVSGFLWHGNPGKLIDAAQAGSLILCASAPLLAELHGVLGREKCAKHLQIRGLTATQIFEGYAALATVVVPAIIPPAIADDPDERLLAKSPPGWSAKELLDELLTRTVRIVALERDLILERALIDDEMEGRLRGATPRGSDLVVRLTLDDVDDLSGHVAAEANHCSEPRVRRVLDAVYDRLAGIEHAFTDEGEPAETPESKPFTAKQGQYLAYIHYYTKIHGRPPAEADLQRFFRVTPPVVHQMIKTLTARRVIDREPGTARSIRLRLTRAQLPDLE